MPVRLTRDTLVGMTEVTIRELRNRGGDIIDRVQAGEPLTVTRSGRHVAELRPLPRKSLAAAVLLERWRCLPHVNPDELRGDIDRVVDPSL